MEPAPLRRLDGRKLWQFPLQKACPLRHSQTLTLCFTGSYERFSQHGSENKHPSSGRKMIMQGVQNTKTIILSTLDACTTPARTWEHWPPGENSCAPLGLYQQKL